MCACGGRSFRIREMDENGNGFAEQDGRGESSRFLKNGPRWHPLIAHVRTQNAPDGLPSGTHRRLSLRTAQSRR